LNAGWRADKLHIANNSPRNVQQIIVRREETDGARHVNIYRMSSSTFLCHRALRNFVGQLVLHPLWVVDGWLDIQYGISGSNQIIESSYPSETFPNRSASAARAAVKEQGGPRLEFIDRDDRSVVTDANGDVVPNFWHSQALEHVSFPVTVDERCRVSLNKCASAFSLVYLDYTTNTHRTQDLHSLQGLLRRGVLAVCCPAFAEHVPAGTHRHRRAEAANLLMIGPYSVALAPEYEFAGLLKICFEVAPLVAELCEAFVYRGCHRRTNMWFAAFRIYGADVDSNFNGTSDQAHVMIRGRALGLQQLKTELLVFLLHRNIIRNGIGRIVPLCERQTISWRELTETHLPALSCLVDELRRIARAPASS